MIVIDSICIHSYNYTDLDRYGISSGLSQAEVLSISSPVAALVAPSFQARVAPMGSPTHALAALAMSSSRVLDPTHTDRHTHTQHKQPKQHEHFQVRLMRFFKTNRSRKNSRTLQLGE